MRPAAAAMNVTVEEVDAGAATFVQPTESQTAPRGPLAQALVDRSQAGRPEAEASGHTGDARAAGVLEYTTNGPAGPLSNNLNLTVHGKPVA